MIKGYKEWGNGGIFFFINTKAIIINIWVQVSTPAFGDEPEIVQTGDVLEQESTVVADLTLQGKALMTNSLEQMQSINTVMQHAVQKVEGLNNQSTEITDFPSEKAHSFCNERKE